MRAVVSPDRMREIDAAAADPVAVLIERAGFAVARAALAMLGGAYGRRVTVLAGPGNNGADGRSAAAHLRRRGVVVDVVDIDRRIPPPDRLSACDLVIDAALGTGFTGTYVAPDVDGSPVLAIDIPSGLDAASGVRRSGSRILAATRTVTFAAWKPGLLFGDGPALAGAVEVVDIGLPVPGATCHVLDGDVARDRLPTRAATAHKWTAAITVIGGSPGMTGAPRLAARAAMRAGAGMVRVGVPGDQVGGDEAVGVALPLEHWGGVALGHLERSKAFVLGPGLGRSRTAMIGVGQLLSRAEIPCVLDGDGLAALAPAGGHGLPAATFASGAPGSGRSAAPAEPDALPALSAGRKAVLDAAARRSGVRARSFAAAEMTPRASSPTGMVGGSGRGGAGSVARVRALGANGDGDLDAAIEALADRAAGSTVLTPHDGEFERITGRGPGEDRVGAVLRLAQATGAIVLLKGPTTVVAAPDGRVELVRAGDSRLATAGSGDVLSGIIAALLAQGLAPFEAAACGAYVHGAASLLGHSHGLVAGDLTELLPRWWDSWDH